MYLFYYIYIKFNVNITSICIFIINYCQIIIACQFIGNIIPLIYLLNTTFDPLNL